MQRFSPHDLSIAIKWSGLGVSHLRVNDAPKKLVCRTITLNKDHQIFEALVDVAAYQFCAVVRLTSLK